jgi:cyanuric acid amidohydrolase
MAGPDDAQGIVAALQALGPARIDRLALAVKVEGTATINDFSRALALRAIDEAIAAAGIGHAERQIIISTGCEGICSPGGYLIADVRDEQSEFPALAFGVGQSGKLDARDMIGVEHVTAAALATKRAMDQAGLTPSQVALVLLKSPVLTRAAAAAAGPAARAARANSTALSRGVAALGVGCLLGEIDITQIDEDAIPGRADLYSTRAMVFSGTETDACEAIVLGNLPGLPPSILSGLTQDLLDIEGLAKIAGHGDPEAGRENVRQGRVHASFFKAGSSADGRIRGGRTTLHASEMDPDKQLRGAASGVLGAFLGSTQFFISGGAEHQAPPGQCLFAALVGS